MKPEFTIAGVPGMVKAADVVDVKPDEFGCTIHLVSGKSYKSSTPAGVMEGYLITKGCKVDKV